MDLRPLHFPMGLSRTIKNFAFANARPLFCLAKFGTLMLSCLSAGPEYAGHLSRGRRNGGKTRKKVAVGRI